VLQSAPGALPSVIPNALKCLLTFTSKWALRSFLGPHRDLRFASKISNSAKTWQAQSCSGAQYEPPNIQRAWWLSTDNYVWLWVTICAPPHSSEHNCQCLVRSCPRPFLRNRNSKCKIAQSINNNVIYVLRSHLSPGAAIIKIASRRPWGQSLIVSSTWLSDWITVHQKTSLYQNSVRNSFKAYHDVWSWYWEKRKIYYLLNICIMKHVISRLETSYTYSRRHKVREHKKWPGCSPQ
jgi:hypothetical protein